MDNKKKGMGIFIVAILAISVFAVVTTPASANSKEEAIDKGLAWLAAQQDPTTGAWSLDYYPVGSTAFAVLKFEHHAKYTLGIDPFSDDYEYKDNIEDGLRYLFNNTYSIDISPQPAGDPDVNLVNGKGIYFSSGRPLYETGIAMMALEASCHPERIVDAPGSPVHGWTYLDVMKDTVDYIAWAQNEAGNGRGGWRYFPNYDNSDNSVSQWPVLGLMSAAGWDVHAPDWVRTELEDYWLVFSQNTVNGGFGYTSSAGPNIALTASGLIQLTYCGVTTDDDRWKAARQWICENWDTGNIGNFYAMYGVMKAAMTAQPQPPNPVWDFCGHKWQDEYDAWLMANQNADGSWPPQWTNVLATEWALLILQKVVPPVPPPAPVPAMTPIGLIALIGLLSVVAVISIRTSIRKKRR